jgi:hypothetical protein
VEGPTALRGTLGLLFGSLWVSGCFWFAATLTTILILLGLPSARARASTRARASSLWVSGCLWFAATLTIFILPSARASTATAAGTCAAAAAARSRSSTAA